MLSSEYVQKVGRLMAQTDERSPPMAPAILDDATRAWLDFCRLHMAPSRLFTLALGLRMEEPADREHLEQCEKCRAIFHAYQKPKTV